MYKKVEVKLNGGRGACLCNRCSVILSYGMNHEDVDRYCGSCYNQLVSALTEIANASAADLAIGNKLAEFIVITANSALTENDHE